MAPTVLPCACDLSGTPRSPSLPEMPHESGAQGTRSPALPSVQGAVPDRRWNPRDADRGSQARVALPCNTGDMTIKRLDHVSVVVEYLTPAIAFFTALGMTVDGEAPIEGP